MTVTSNLGQAYCDTDHQRERKRLTHKHTNENRMTKAIWTSPIDVRVCAWCTAQQGECVYKSYHRKHSGPKPASDAWHLHPSSRATSPKTHHPSKSPWSGGRSDIKASLHLKTAHTHTINSSHPPHKKNHPIWRQKCESSVCCSEKQTSLWICIPGAERIAQKGCIIH